MSDDPKVKTTVPAGCETAPGWILEVAAHGPWLKLDGSITDIWAERGVWLTVDDANAALDRFLE
jgi:hypothetical protein